MTEKEADRYISNNKGITVIDGCTDGLYYFISKDDNRVAIGGDNGIAIVTRKQAECIVEDLVGIFDMMNH